MTAYQSIVQAIKDFGYPYEPEVYQGKAERYFTYNYADDRGDLFSDDAPETTVASVQVHFVLPAGDPFAAIKKRIREALLRQGFTYPEVTNNVDAENNIRQLVFECEIEEEIEETEEM